MHPHEVVRLGAGGLAVILIAVAVLGRRCSSRQRTRAALGAGLTALTTTVAGVVLFASSAFPGPAVHPVDAQCGGPDGKLQQRPSQ